MKANIITEKELEIFLSDALLRIGGNACLNGFEYIIDAVKCLLRRPQEYIFKELYPEVAKLNNAKAANVERNIRNAIECIWNRGKGEEINKLFGVKLYSPKEKPANGHFLMLLTECAAKEFYYDGDTLVHVRR